MHIRVFVFDISGLKQWFDGLLYLYTLVTAFSSLI